MLSGQTISVCVPALNEEATIGAVVEAVKGSGCADEILVLNHSTDDTAGVAREAGATVVEVDGVLPEFGRAEGKGDVLWRSLAVAEGDLVVWVDADLSSLEPGHIAALARPFVDPAICLVKGTCQRVFGGERGEGGRVTELTARPLLRLLRPELARIRQPLAGEYAIRAQCARELSFETDYGVDVGLLIDVADRFGVESIEQVDLGAREHRNRPLADLHEQAVEVSRSILCRSGHPGLAAPQRPPLAELAVGSSPETLGRSA